MKINKKSADSIVSVVPLRLKAYRGSARRDEIQPLPPHYISGFVDGEGCFAISICKHNTCRYKKEVRLEFEIELREDDRQILQRIQKTLGCGRIYVLNYPRYRWQPHVKFKVSTLEELDKKVIPFFQKYPLQAKKRKVFEIFCQAVILKKQKIHLQKKGLLIFCNLQKKIRKFGKKLDNR